MIKKFARAASEVKPILQPARISEFYYKSKTSPVRRRNTLVRANSLERKPSKSWWPFYAYPRSAGWKKLARYLELTPKMLRRREKSLNAEFTSPLFSSGHTRDKKVNSHTDIVKITTVIETIRQKNAKLLEEASDIQRIIRKKRSKRSSRESGNDPRMTESSRHAGEKRAYTAKKRSPYPRHHQDGRKQTYPRKNRVAGRDLNAANNIGIPSTVFYKRIWEYINGTRPHSDIISGYKTLEGESGKDNSTCTNQERISASRENELQATNPDVKPEREFYKRIWDIINATQYGNARVRSKRHTNVPKDKVSSSASAASNQSCGQGKRKIGRDEDKWPQRTNLDERAPRHRRLDPLETIHPREASDPGPHISGFWTVTNKTQWQPKTVVPVVNIARLSDDSSRATVSQGASEVADLNDIPRELPGNSVGTASSTNSTERAGEASTDNSSGITEPGPPYLSQGENITASPTDVIDDASRKDEPVRYVEEPTDNPIYDPSNIPYVEVPDYTDQREDSLDRGNRSSVADEYREYDDGDYVDVATKSRNADKPPSVVPSAGNESPSNIRSGSGSERAESSLNPDAPRSRCAENDDTAGCADKHEESHDNTGSHDDIEDDDVRQPAEDSTDGALSTERENSTADFPPIHFDINEYRKPFDLDDFIKNDPIFESIRAAADKEDAKQGAKEIPDRNDDETEEHKTYATYPKEQSRDYFATNENPRANDSGDISDDRDEATGKNSDSYANEEAKDSEVINEDYYPHDDNDFFKRIFGEEEEEEGEEGDKESYEVADTENDFLSRYFTEDVLRQMRDNSTDEEDRKREESRNRENVYKTLSRILDKKDRFSRLNDDVDKMIEKGEAIPIKYNNFWSLQYESPHKEAKAKEEEEEEEA